MCILRRTHSLLNYPLFGNEYLIIGNTCLLQYCTNIFVVYLFWKRLTRRGYKILEFENRKHQFSWYLKLQIKLIVTQCWQKKRGTWTASPKYREHIGAWIKWLTFHRQQYVFIITGNSIVFWGFFFFFFLFILPLLRAIQRWMSNAFRCHNVPIVMPTIFTKRIRWYTIFKRGLVFRKGYAIICMIILNLKKNTRC